MTLPESENVVISQGPCPSCTSSAAHTIYSDGGSACFSFAYHTKGNGETPLRNTHRAHRIDNYDGPLAPPLTRNTQETAYQTCNASEA